MKSKTSSPGIPDLPDLPEPPQDDLSGSTDLSAFANTNKVPLPGPLGFSLRDEPPSGGKSHLARARSPVPPSGGGGGYTKDEIQVLR